jgi:DnaJ-domain-containing protein 1
MNEQLEKLIDFALADGILTDKEKEVLYRKANEFGVDQDEFEMVLEAKLFEKQKSMKEESLKTKEAAPKSDKFGDVKKCPACGSMVQSFQIKCIDCGHEFSNIESNASINKLFEMLNDAENERKDEGMSVDKALGKMFSEAFGVGDKVNSKKKTIISNFPIPTTKNDILEFLSLAIPNAKKAGNFFTSGSFNSPANHRNKLHNDFVNVWKTKCEQIIMKARFSMKEDKKTLDEINNYAKELKIK